MKKIYLLMIFTFLFHSCGGDGSDVDYKEKMREFVIGISEYAKAIDSAFIIIPQNGQELVTVDGNGDGDPATEYLNAIDGVGREDLFYGYDSDDVATSAEDTEYMTDFLDICELNYVQVLTTDYCSDTSNVDSSYTKNEAKGYISFAAPYRELDRIPTYPADPYNENINDINTLSEAKNFLYLINFDGFSDKADFIADMQATNYDLIIMDMFFEGTSFTSAEINDLKIKNNGHTRLVISYMSIGEAENYRYYWQSWSIGSPSWIVDGNPHWPGNYVVKYWESQWQNIIFGNDTSYLKKIMDAGFDGVYLDIIDAFEYFE